MRITGKVIVSGILILAGSMLGWRLHDWRQPVSRPSAAEIGSGPTLEQIQTLASLATLKVNVADPLVTELRGRTGGITAVMVVQGNVTLGVDLSRARFESVDPKSRTAVLVLPAPQVESVGLDQERTKVVALCESGLWVIVPGRGDADAATASLAYHQAERAVAQAANEPELVQRARAQAESVLSAFSQVIQWQVQTRWADAPVLAGCADRGGIV